MNLKIIMYGPAESLKRSISQIWPSHYMSEGKDNCILNALNQRNDKQLKSELRVK